MSICFNLYVFVINSAQLLYYVNNGDFDKVKELVDKNKSIWVSDKRGRNVLQVAAKECHFNIVKYIIEKRWSELRLQDINRAIDEAYTALNKLHNKRRKLIVEVADLMKDPKLFKAGNTKKLDKEADIKNAQLQACRKKIWDCQDMIKYLKMVRRKKIRLQKR